MTKAIDTKLFEEKTGKSWEEWIAYLDGIGAKDLTHTQIAEKVYETGCPGWWGQSVTVAYEQHIGRRLPGQDSTGTFTLSVTKTLPGNIDEALVWWIERTSAVEAYNAVKPIAKPDVSQSEKWRYWRVSLADGSKIVVTIAKKTDDKALFALQHEKLASAKASDAWRVYWKAFIS